MPTPAQTFRARRLLTRELSDVSLRLGGLAPLETSARTGDEADRVQALEEHDLGVADRARLHARRLRLVAALARLDADTYGLCLACEAPIAPARLTALPEVERCVGCQDQLERTKAEEPGRRRRRLPDDEEDC